MQAPHLAPSAHDGVEYEAAEEAEERQDHQAGDQDSGREARPQTGLKIGDRQRDREDDRQCGEKEGEASVKQYRPLDPVEVEDRLEDTPSVAIGRKLGLRSFRARAISSVDLADGHCQLERVNADFGLCLEPPRQGREGFRETARKYPVSREDVAERAAEQARQQPGEDLVAEDV